MCPPLAGGEGSWARGVEIVTGRVPRQDCPELLCARPLSVAGPIIISGFTVYACAVGRRGTRGSGPVPRVSAARGRREYSGERGGLSTPRHLGESVRLRLG